MRNGDTSWGKVTVPEPWGVYHQAGVAVQLYGQPVSCADTAAGCRCHL